MSTAGPVAGTLAGVFLDRVRFQLLGEEWTVESGELTPSLKVRRAVVLRSHARQIDEMYAEGGPGWNEA